MNRLDAFRLAALVALLLPGWPALAQVDNQSKVAMSPVPRVDVTGSLVFNGADTVANQGISTRHTISGTSTTPNAGIYELNVVGDTAKTRGSGSSGTESAFRLKEGARTLLLTLRER